MNEGAIDRPVPVREGEALDAGALGAFLQAHGLASAGDVRVSQFPRGFSNLTYLVECRDRSFALRRPPYGWGQGKTRSGLPGNWGTPPQKCSFAFIPAMSRI